MDITIKYLGMLAETTGCSTEVVSFQKTSIAEFLEGLYVRHPGLRHKEFKVAQQQQLVDENEEVTGAEIALLPPFSGG